MKISRNLVLVTLPVSLLAATILAVGCSDEGGDEICAVCIEEKCSDLVDLCEPDPDCACMVDCVGQSGIPGVDGCLETCGLDYRPPNFAEVEECVADACPDTEDECSTPDGWTPPDDTVPCDGSGTGGIGSGELPDCAFDADLTFDPDGEVLQLQSADEGVCARVERRDDGAGSLANTSWTLLRLHVGPSGEVALIDSLDDLCWYSSHHNFRDWAHAWTGTRRYDLAVRHEGEHGDRTYLLYVYEQGPVDPAACSATSDGSMCIDGPVELFPVNP